MKIPLFAFAVMLSIGSKAQYYYNDIAGAGESSRLMQTYLANRVKMVTATGVDANGVKATDFAEVQEVKDNGRTLKISTRNKSEHSVDYSTYDERGRLISSTDSSTSSSSIQNTTTYQYDDAGRIVQVQTILNDPSGGFSKKEDHYWLYNKAGKPERMWRVINNSDSLEIRFTPDENGNPGEETTYRWGLETDRIYYYYDEQGRVTDIVRFNKKVKKLLPDIIISYDDAGRMIQKITSSAGDNLGRITWVGYVIWRYIYNDKGLKIREALFDKEQQLTGKIEYSYSFQQ